MMLYQGSDCRLQDFYKKYYLQGWRFFYVKHRLTLQGESSRELPSQNKRKK